MARTKKNGGHFGGGGLGELHIEVKNVTEGGACLIGHKGSHKNFTGKSTCNYRYQALEQAKSHGEIQKYLHSYNTALDKINRQYRQGVQTSAYDTQKGGKFPAYYCAKIALPKKGDWDVGGPEKNIESQSFSGDTDKIIAEHNFTRDTWPYWNNAHHLIPKGTLKQVMQKQESEVSELMQQGLLQAHYNINHKINMLFLPQDKEVGKILDMPRHIQLKEGDSDVAQSCTNHSVYNEMVIKELKKIIKGYCKMINKAQTDNACETPDFERDKSKLEKLSRKLLTLILHWEGGRSLDSLSHRQMSLEN